MAKIVNPYIVLVKGGEPTPPTEGKYLVQVIDYDGTVLKSAKLNTGDTFTLPDAPTGRPRLTFQEWSSPVAITNNTITVGDSDITIGATYTTTSGLTEFDITLTEVTGLTVTCNMAGTKNWGDGTSDATTSHTYSATGNYMITCDGTTIPTRVMGQSDTNINYTLIRTRISNSVTSIGNYAFQNCYSLTSITIPNGVTTIGNYVFQNCYSLTSITIPNGVTGIGDYAFGKCYSLTSITIPNSINVIKGSAFQNCSSITSITIPNGVTTIGNYNFQSCLSLTCITIPNSVTSIGDYAFPNCYSLISVTILNGVKTIGSNAFQNCYFLTSVTIPSSVTNIGSNAFDYCFSLTSITIPSSVTIIRSNAFQNCHSLTSITIPNSVKTIGEIAFQSCRSLTSVTIPSSVTSIGSNAFNYCFSIIEYDFSTFTSVPTLSNKNAFNDINGLCKMLIPSALIDTWKAATNWSTYAKYMVAV